ncbi:PLP-dependent aminotransferase family protein [Aestuariispira insulae]|uniref:GntR family transcriptional regulator n=1 Tax=Aestuariispira insulae TaxID=1461337 RepID=A0A3D9HK02_9PROT|nr:PLP-dependent aminotransferase family protein [Aestuariispira insulae]RED49798.1 GntR family transcriptional regulator [Aestuariispira insulae]
MTIRQISWLPDLTGRSGAKYQVIADCLADDIASGRLAVGTRLPTHRDLAWELKVTVGTVSRAYREAERRGLIAGEVGRGTYVQTPRSSSDSRSLQIPSMDTHLPQEEHDTDDPSKPINLVFNFPPPGLAKKVIRKTLVELADDPLMGDYIGYQPHIGMERHRAAGTKWLAKRGINAAPDDIMIAPGAHCGVLIALSSLTNPGDLVITERLSYASLKSIARTLGLRLETVEMDHDGIDPQSLEQVIREKRPAALVCVPTLSNPTNIITSVPRRHEIADVVLRHGLPVVEDDIFALLLPEGEAPPPLSTLIPDQSIFVTSLSKTVSPGLRIGYVAGPTRYKPAISSAIRATNWMASPLTSEIASRWILDGNADMILESHKREAAVRKDMFDERFGPIGAEYALPTGAIHAWLEVPESVRAAEFIRAAEKQGVLLCPHDAFSVGRAETPHAVRISLGPPRQRATLAKALDILLGIYESGPAINDFGYV